MAGRRLKSQCDGSHEKVSDGDTNEIVSWVGGRTAWCSYCEHPVRLRSDGRFIVHPVPLDQ